MTEKRDPIHEHEGKWYFWDETWTERMGGYTEREKAERELVRYVDWLTTHPNDEEFEWEEEEEQPTIPPQCDRCEDKKFLKACLKCADSERPGWILLPHDVTLDGQPKPDYLREWKICPDCKGRAEFATKDEVEGKPCPDCCSDFAQSPTNHSAYLERLANSGRPGRTSNKEPNYSAPPQRVEEDTEVKCTDCSVDNPGYICKNPSAPNFAQFWILCDTCKGSGRRILKPAKEQPRRLHDLEDSPEVEFVNPETFRATGLMFLVNQFLHAFGYAICVQTPGKIGGQPRLAVMRTKYRGFNYQAQDEGYKKIAEFMADNGGRLLEEVAENDLSEE